MRLTYLPVFATILLLYDCNLSSSLKLLRLKTALKWLSAACRTFRIGAISSLLDTLFLEVRSYLARDPFKDQVPFPDDNDDAERRQSLLLKILFLRPCFPFQMTSQFVMAGAPEGP